MMLPDKWCVAPDHPQLSDHEIHLWCVELDCSEGDRHRLALTLSPDEQARAERFRVVRDRHHFIVSRGILRSILGCYLHCQQRELAFRYNAYGKPMLADPFSSISLEFNLSHSEGIALYGLTCHRAIGVDVEYVRPWTEVAALIPLVLSPHEQIQFFTLPSEQQAFSFFQIWTSKEAYLKAIGQGLSHPLHDIEIAIDPLGARTVQSIRGDRQAAAQWSLYDVAIAPHYVATCAVHTRDQPPGCLTQLLKPSFFCRLG